MARAQGVGVLRLDRDGERREHQCHGSEKASAHPRHMSKKRSALLGFVGR
jgi:hypothetical protein